MIPEAVKAEIRKRVDNHYSSAMVVGLMDTNGTSFYSYGTLDPNGEAPVDEDSLFEIGSITKTFTATLLADMAERGELALTNLIQDYLPAGVTAPVYGAQRIPITLTHLSAHRSGLPRMAEDLPGDGTLNPFEGSTTVHMYDFLDRYRLTRQPGSQYEYSNVAVGLLGQLLARLRGVDYEALLRERLTEVLGLKDTVIRLSPEQESRAVVPYHGAVRYPVWDMGAFDSAGGLRSSAREMMTYLKYNLGIIDSPLHAAMTNAHQPRFFVRPGTEIGLGWFTANLGETKAVTHDGQTGAFSTFAGFLPGERRAVVTLSTGWMVVSDLFGHLLVPALRGVRSYPVPALVSAEVRRRYTGKYVSGSRSYAIRQERDHLTFTYSDGQGPTYSGDPGLADTVPGFEYTLYAESTNRFRTTPSIDATAIFNRNAAGWITSVTWIQDGASTVYGKEAVKPRLEIVRAGASHTLLLSGEPDRSYVVESSNDLREWTPVATNSIWDPRLELPSSTLPGRAFYRARQ